MSKIKKLKDVKLIEDNQSLAIYLADKWLFYYLDFISKKNELLSIETNNQSESNNILSPIHLDTEITLYCFTKTWHVSDKYSIIAQYIAMLTLVQDDIYKLLTYNKDLHSPKSAKWQDAIQEKYNALVKNHK